VVGSGGLVLPVPGIIQLDINPSLAGLNKVRGQWILGIHAEIGPLGTGHSVNGNQT